MGDERKDKPEKQAATPAAPLLDMGQGSREQAFRLQKPKLTLVRSR